MVIHIRVDNDTLSVKEPSAIVGGSKNYYELSAIFTADWEGLTCYAVFPSHGCSVAMNADGTTLLPEALTAEGGVLKLGLIGVDNEENLRIATNYVCIRVIEGAKKADAPPPLPASDAWREYVSGVIDSTQREQLAEVRSEIADLSGKAATVKGGEFADYGNIAVVSGAREIEDGGVKLSDITADIASAHSDIAALTSDLADTKQQLTSVRNDFDSFSEASNCYLEQLGIGLEDARSDISFIADGLNNNNAALATLTADLESGFDNVRSDMRALAFNVGVINTAEGKTISITDSAAAPIKELHIYGASRQLQTTGAQLLDMSSLNSSTRNGVTLTVNADGTISVHGTATATAAWSIPWVGNGSLIYSTTYSNSSNIGTVGLRIFARAYLNGTSVKTTAQNNVLDLTNVEYDSLAMMVQVDAGRSVDVDGLRLMVNEGSELLPWEAYSGGYASPSVNFTQDIVPVCNEENEITVMVSENAIHLPTGIVLNAIPVNTGGTYTDESERHLAADEVCCENGRWTYYRRIKKLYLDVCQWHPQGEGANKYYITIDDATSAAPLCNFAIVASDLSGAVCYNASLKRLLVDLDQLGLETLEDFTNYLSAARAYIVYETENPFASELNINASISTDGATTITNSIGAYMEAYYIADAKGYIDNKLDENIFTAGLSEAQSDIAILLGYATDTQAYFRDVWDGIRALTDRVHDLELQLGEITANTEEA